MTNEQIAKAKECKSAEELLALAKENGIEMTQEEADEQYALLHNEGELSDDELDSASGGACHTTVEGQKFTVVTNGLNCFTGEYEEGYITARDPDTMRLTTTPIRSDHYSLRKTWQYGCMGRKECGSCLHLEFKNGTGYCGKSGQ